MKLVNEKKSQMLTRMALMTTIMSVPLGIADRFIEKDVEVPFVCTVVASDRASIESFPLDAY